MADKDQDKARRKLLELEAKLERKRMKAATKQVEKEAKLVHKYGEAAAERIRRRDGTPKTAKVSGAVRYAETVRGILYILLGVTLVGALILGQRDVITSFDDVVNSLFWATAGKVVLGAIAVAFVIYGLKYLRVVR